MRDIKSNLRELDLGSEFEFKTSRSGGKGGQNVNKVETKIELIFNVINSVMLTEEQKFLISTKLKNRIDKEGNLRLVSQTERSQLLNKQIAVKKFYELIKSALKKTKPRKKTKPHASSVESRIQSKKKTSVKKALRKSHGFNSSDD